MTYSYFPGCTLKNKAVDLDLYARASAEKLGFTLEEIPEWQCCGGVYPMGSSEVASKLSSVRALAYSRDSGQDLVTLCSACYNVLKQVNSDMQNDQNGETKVLHFLEVLRDVVGWDKVKAAVKNPLRGRKIGAYYGCLLLRPAGVMQFDDPENPKIIEDFIKAIGATPVIYAQRNECCGAYAMFEDSSIPKNRAKAIISNAEDFGAELLVTSCPLCRYNLIKNRKGSSVDVIYFSELLAEALGIKEEVLASKRQKVLEEAVNA